VSLVPGPRRAGSAGAASGAASGARTSGARLRTCRLCASSVSPACKLSSNSPIPLTPTEPIEEEEESEEPPAPEPEPEDDAPGAGTPNAPPPTNGRRGVTRRGRGGVDLGSWELFWTVNRDAYISLRRFYHDGPPTSGTKAGDGRRPSRAVLSTKLLPLVQTLSRGEGELRASAIMAAALAAQAPADAKPVVAAARVYLRDPGSRYRDLLLLALGVVKDAEATALLLAIARDERDGRDALGRRSRIPERTRAFAAEA